MIEAYERDGALLFKVRVVPRAYRSEIAGEHDGALRVRVAAPPVEGKANKALRVFLARRLAVPPSRIAITRGVGSRHKLVEIEGITTEEALQRLRA